VRRIAADLIRRRDTASLLGLMDALRMRTVALAAQPAGPAQLTGAEILEQSHQDLAELLRI